jgi:hypothetical protein
VPTHPKPKPKAGQAQKQLPPSERLAKILKNREEQGLAYEYDSQDKREVIFTELRKRYADTLKLSFKWIIRVKFPQPGSDKEYLVYHLNETITDRDNNDRHFDSRQGVWPAAEASGKINPETGQRENARLKREYNVFDIEYTPQKARDIIYDKRLVLQPSEFLIGYATEDTEDIVTGRKWNVWNVEEFISMDFETLMYGAERGWLEKEEGGALRAKAEMQANSQNTVKNEQQIPPKRK